VDEKHSAAGDDYDVSDGRDPRFADDPAAREQHQAKVAGNPLSYAELEEVRRAALEADEDARYTLRELFVLISGASILLALGTRLPPGAFAGLLGLVTLAALAALAWFNLRAAVVQLAWWMLLALYLLAIARAIWGT